jgi:hypothetical protein
MTDVETMLREAIAHGTGGPPPADLVERVHQRVLVRRRRRGAVAAGLSAATVAVVAVVTAQLTGPDARPPSADRTGDASPTSTPTVVGGPSWRVESSHDVQVEVPDDWGYGSRGEWCTASGLDGWKVPRVQLGDNPSFDARCPEPSQSYGLSFVNGGPVDLAQPSASIWQYGDEGVYPDGAWLSIVVEGDVAVLVAAPDRDTVQHIVDSVDPVRGANAVDGNGCFPKAERAFGRADPVPGTVSVCRYEDGFWLSQSERLTGADAAESVAALDAAPVMEYRPCPMDKVPPPSIELVTSEGVADLQWNPRCTGVYWKNTLRKLTPEVMYWALSPGFQGPLPADVPLPDEFRTR